MRIRQRISRSTAVPLVAALFIMAATPAGAVVNTVNMTVTTPEQLAQTVVPGATVGNPVYTGDPGAAGTFAGGDVVNGIGIATGATLSSGDIESAEIVPNNNMAGKASNDNAQPGDPDLDALFALVRTFDAAVLEFDFTPGLTDSVLTLPLVFASEEYTEQVGFINDGVAVFVNGVNVALVPGTVDPISISTVNPLVNAAFFNDNNPFNFAPAPPPFADFVQYDGFTDVLMLRTPVKPGAVNHMKIAIADDDDFFIDSAVFIGPGVFADLTPDIAALVTKYYNDILGRAPEAQGLDFWTSEILRTVNLGVNVGEGFAALARFFFSSPEYIARARTNPEYVADLYQTFLNRLPDPAGQAFWEAEVAAVGREVVLNGFAFSVEFGLFLESSFGLPPSRPENNLVNDFYRGLLNRLPDDGGFLAWLGQMQTAQCTAAQAVRDTSAQIAQSFIGSAEYALRARTDLEFVEDLYNAFLRRGGGQAEFDHWVNQLAGGSARLDVLQAFVVSAEFQLRVQNVIDAGCPAP